MGSENTDLPVIDLSKEAALQPGSPEWDLVKVKVRDALKEFGCFKALYNKVPLELQSSFFGGAVEELFNLPSEIKQRNVSKTMLHGYRESNPMVPLLESLGFDDLEVFQEVENSINKLWPRGKPTISKLLHCMGKQLVEIDQAVRRMVFESMGVEKYLEEHMNSTSYILRVMKYKPTYSTEPQPGIIWHTDKHMLTILYQNEVDSLEVQTKDGDSISVKLSPDSFVVLIGDPLYAWTNGHLHNPLHRVMLKGNETRYSTSTFSIPKAGFTVRAPVELVDKEHPLLFKPFDHYEYIESYSQLKLGRLHGSTLKIYCGI
ncbi:probable 2-oxoglutarate-dependent dioxygenase AOP1 [Tripterygium wilfordii]|uniref:probable 2-oxoglutarate-dependent dioxygenase AOP1 n=1 Tax=Tripterygium wilfordii TaxID=458696 RepID=UPI0018F7E97D|nr:probable 2-oxoglutarate-dependent dioxygenase AOP1 [Tripterygium wilfordii]